MGTQASSTMQTKIAPVVAHLLIVSQCPRNQEPLNRRGGRPLYGAIAAGASSGFKKEGIPSTGTLIPLEREGDYVNALSSLKETQNYRCRQPHRVGDTLSEINISTRLGFDKTDYYSAVRRGTRDTCTIQESLKRQAIVYLYPLRRRV